jgi:hypothetical protein
MAVAGPNKESLAVLECNGGERKVGLAASWERPAGGFSLRLCDMLTQRCWEAVVTAEDAVAHGKLHNFAGHEWAANARAALARPQRNYEYTVSGGEQPASGDSLRLGWALLHKDNDDEVLMVMGELHMRPASPAAATPMLLLQEGTSRLAARLEHLARLNKERNKRRK